MSMNIVPNRQQSSFMQHYHYLKQKDVIAKDLT